jgi:hypothetical protein
MILIVKKSCASGSTGNMLMLENPQGRSPSPPGLSEIVRAAYVGLTLSAMLGIEPSHPQGRIKGVRGVPLQIRREEGHAPQDLMVVR